MDESAFDMATCLRQVRQGDQDAARSFMERLYPLVLKVVRARLPRRTEEEDLVQSVFMKVFTHLKEYSGLVPVEHWVSRIAVNTALNVIKAEKIRPEWRWSDLTEDQRRVLDTLAATEADLDQEQRFAAREILDQLMGELSPSDRLVIQLLHLEDKSIAEIRQLTGWSVATVKVRAFRARRKLHHRLRALQRKGRL